MDTRERILQLIEQHYSSDAAFERDASVNSKTVDSWRRKKSKAYLNLLPTLAKLLGTTTSYLLCETDNPNPTIGNLSPAEAELVAAYKALDLAGQRTALHLVRSLYATNPAVEPSKKLKSEIS
jgi:transcriptional regulator with XRE-family HTH domain